jgi:hypothetical protein
MRHQEEVGLVRAGFAEFSWPAAVKWEFPCRGEYNDRAEPISVRGRFDVPGPSMPCIGRFFVYKYNKNIYL